MEPSLALSTKSHNYIDVGSTPLSIIASAWQSQITLFLIIFLENGSNFLLSIYIRSKEGAHIFLFAKKPVYIIIHEANTNFFQYCHFIVTLDSISF